LVNRNSLNRAKQALAASEQRFSSFFRHLPNGCIIFRFVRDSAGEIVDLEILDVNIVAGEDMNLSISKLIGGRVRDFFAIETLPHLEYYRRLVETGEPQTFESYYKPNDRWFLCSASVLRDDLYSLVAVDITDWKRSEEQCRVTEERLKSALQAANRISRYMETVRENERRNIAREIHDELGQALTALKIDLFRLKGSSAELGEDHARSIDQMSDLVSNIIQDVRRISSELRPRMLDDLGLVPAIEWLVQDFGDRMGIPCTFDSTNVDSCTSTACATAIFRIVQESLTNVCRHARASRVAITLCCGDGTAFLEIVDDGVGITSEHLSSEDSLGLLGIKERAHMCGGKADIVGQPGKGTTVTAVIPCSGIGVFNHENSDC
ncbi:MAG TPA: histidine kinase, partial [Geobacteraceae bacterium]|nr:histidine kinase [Geobacteraceae bacterium]